MRPSLSTYLDGMRIVAAFSVFLGHASKGILTGNALPDMEMLAQRAVVAFFVLSGFVIAHVAQRKETTLAEFASARMARLYSVAIPALALTYLADQVGWRLDWEIYRKLYDAWGWDFYRPLLRTLVSLGFANQIWFLNVSAFSNIPYWSISYEAAYYIFFACMFFLPARRRWWAAALVLLVAGLNIVLLLPVWLLGVLAYKFHGRLTRTSGAALFAASIVIGLFFVWFEEGIKMVAWPAPPSWEELPLLASMVFERYAFGLIIVANIAGFAALRWDGESSLLGRSIHWLAGATFSLYLFHYPLLHVFAAALPGNSDEIWRVCTLLAGVIFAVLGLAALTERQKHRLRPLTDRLVAAVLCPTCK